MNLAKQGSNDSSNEKENSQFQNTRNLPILMRPPPAKLKLAEYNSTKFNAKNAKINVTRLEFNFLKSTKSIHRLLEREMLNDSTLSKKSEKRKRCRSSVATSDKRSLSPNKSLHRNGSPHGTLVPAYQYDCDQLQKQIAIVHQSEYILQGFKRKEKEMAANYDRIVRDQDAQIKRLERQLTELAQTHAKEEEILSQLVKEKDKMIKGLQVQIEQAVSKGEKQPGLDIEKLIEVKIEDIRKQHLEQAKKESDGKLEAQLTELKADNSKLQKEVEDSRKERETVHLVNIELMDEHENLIAKYEEVKRENRELLASNDVFQEAIISELVQLNDLIARKKQSKKKEQSKRVMDEILKKLSNSFQSSFEVKHRTRSRSRQDDRSTLTTACFEDATARPPSKRGKASNQPGIHSTNPNHQHQAYVNYQAGFKDEPPSMDQQAQIIVVDQQQLAHQQELPHQASLLQQQAQNLNTQSQSFDQLARARPATHVRGTHSRNKTVNKFVNIGQQNQQYMHTHNYEDKASISQAGDSTVMTSQFDRVNCTYNQAPIDHTTHMDVMDIIIDSISQQNEAHDKNISFISSIGRKSRSPYEHTNDGLDCSQFRSKSNDSQVARHGGYKRPTNEYNGTMAAQTKEEMMQTSRQFAQPHGTTSIPPLKHLLRNSSLCSNSDGVSNSQPDFNSSMAKATFPPVYSGTQHLKTLSI